MNHGGNGSEHAREKLFGEKYSRRHGAIRDGDNALHWNLWAPFAEEVELVLNPKGRSFRRRMERDGDWFVLSEPEVPDGVEYLFAIKGETLPDPASRWQPNGVHSPSAVYSPESFQWDDHDWRGVKRQDLVIYELHVGTFTKDGTFEAIISRLDDLKSLGVTAIELMPVAQFPGDRNWGYDGVHPFAVQNSYGGPRALQELVNAAHRSGLAVILDVVHNHLGPEGNYLSKFGPYFTSSYSTPWGAALNFDGPLCDPVRQYMIENACMWVRDFHVDGIRMDAVHAIYDLGARPLLAEMQASLQQFAASQNRIVHFIAECDRNDPRFIDPVKRNGIGFNAAWADDFHHSVHALLTGNRSGYFADFGELEDLAKAYERIYVYDGRYSIARQRKHGRSIGRRDRTQFIVCIHNHDQIGNRAKGDRPCTSLSPAIMRLMCGLLLISPAIPLLFMGEEYGEQHPFPYFCSFGDPDLIDAVRRGRREEFASLGFKWDDDIPDPQSEATFLSAKLSWKWPAGSVHCRLRQLYRELIALRKSDRGLLDRQSTQVSIMNTHSESGDQCSVLVVKRGASPGTIAVVNPGPNVVSLPDFKFGQRQCLLSTEEPRFGGNGLSEGLPVTLSPFEMRIYGFRYESYHKRKRAGASVRQQTASIATKSPLHSSGNLSTRVQ